jgi:hypothetical protein
VEEDAQSAQQQRGSAQGGGQPSTDGFAGCFHQVVDLAGGLRTDDLGQVLSHPVARGLLAEDQAGEHHGENE